MYLHKDAEGKVIYIGKARNLQNRVRSYFSKDGGHSPFSRKMVKLIADFETIVTRTEKEALILENNLVKMHKPQYNIRLKDDKRYPYLKITLNDEFPALLEVRKPKNDKATYFGPYAGAGKMRQTVALAKRVFKVRTGALISEHGGAAVRGAIPPNSGKAVPGISHRSLHRRRASAPLSPRSLSRAGEGLEKLSGRPLRRLVEGIASANARRRREHGI